MEWICLIAKKNTALAEISSCVFAMMVALIWRERNNIRFQNRRTEADHVLEEIVLHIHARGHTKAKWMATLQYLDSYP